MNNSKILQEIAERRVDSILEELAKISEYGQFRDEQINILKNLKKLCQDEALVLLENLYLTNTSMISMERTAAYIQGLKDGLNMMSEAKETKLCVGL